MSPGRLPYGGCVDPHACREREAAPVHAAERDAARAVVRERVGDLPCGGDGLGGQAEGAGEHARAAAGKEADRHVGVQAVQRLVEPAVAGEHEHGVGVLRDLADELGRVPRSFGQQDAHIGRTGELGDDRVELALAHAGRKRVDDERDAPHQREE
jgi:hypothetical protein